MQDINSTERYSLFTQAVLEAAEREAAALITGAEKEKADMLRAAAHNVAEAEYQKLLASSERACTQLSAQAGQSMRRDLLSYREGLCEELMANVSAKCAEFCQSSAYEPFLKARLDANAQFLAQGGVTVNAREQDVALVQRLCREYTNACVCADNEIVIGGVCLIGKNKIYDETLDTGINEERERFLSYCGLKVV